MNDIAVMKPLYTPDGGQPRGYLCCRCGEVTRTKRGVWAHLRIVHKVKKQTHFEFQEANANGNEPTNRV